MPAIQHTSDDIESRVLTALVSAPWNSTAMITAALKAMDRPLELELALAVEKVIDGWLLRGNGPVRFDAVAREVVATVERLGAV